MDKSETHKLAGSLGSSVKEHFLAWDKEYAHLKWGGPASVRDTQVYLLPGSRVLDAGSGNGRYLGELARHYTAVGIDISLVALHSSRVQLARSSRFAEHLGANLHDLPFKSQSFDGVFCYGVLQHLFLEKGNPLLKNSSVCSKKVVLSSLRPSAVKICAAEENLRSLLKKELLPGKTE